MSAQRFTIRWDDSMLCYRVSVPNFKGPLEVVDATEYDRLRKTLARISDAESGYWGRIAHEALHPKAGVPS